MEKMRFITGSSACPEQPSEFKFKLFNYLIDKRVEKIMHGDVNSGVDAQGPGIYAFGRPDDEPFSQSEIKGANDYSGKDGKGAVIGFDVDMMDMDDEEIKFINEYPADEIPEDEWVDAINDVIIEIRRLNQYEEDEENPYSYDDPASHIFDVGGPESIAREAIERSDNLWQTLKWIWNQTSCVSTGEGLWTYNRAFEKAVIDNVSDEYKLRVAKPHNDDFYVIFDTYEANIQYANTFKYEVDEVKFKSMTNEIGDMLSNYRDQIEPHQIAIKINEIAHSHFGVDLDDDVVKEFSSCKNRYDFEDSLLNKAKQNIGVLVYSEWEKREGNKFSYGVQPEPRPQEKLASKIAFR